MFKVGDYVTRKKYNNDILFKIKEIKDNKIILCGVDIRLIADASSDDLVLRTRSMREKRDYDLVRSLDTSECFYIPGVILHIDSDKDYLEQCLEYYKKQKVKCYGYVFNEKEYLKNIERLINKHKPNVLVITGHDAYNKKNNKYKNSKYFEESVSFVHSKFPNIIIISGACQSDFNSLIRCGSSFASSPSHINIHALDPAIIASFIALSDKNKTIDLDLILSKTKYGKDGIGGIESNGVMLVGMPRKD